MVQTIWFAVTNKRNLDWDWVKLYRETVQST